MSFVQQWYAVGKVLGIACGGFFDLLWAINQAATAFLVVYCCRCGAVFTLFGEVAMSFAYMYQKVTFGIWTEGLFMFLGWCLFAYWLYRTQGKKFDWFFLVSVLAGAVFGGRLWYALTHWGKLDVFSFFNPLVLGNASFGMIMGGVMVALVYGIVNRKKISVLSYWGQMCDAMAPGLALALFVVRMGCFLFGDVPGIPTDVPWAIYGISYGSFSGLTLHPAALYLSLNALVVFIILHAVFLAKRPLVKQRFYGEVGLWFLTLYSLGRFMISFLILGHHWKVGIRYFGLLDGQWVLLFFLIIGTILSLYKYYFSRFVE